MRFAMSNIAWSPDERIDAYNLLANAGMTGLEIAPGLFFHAAEDPFNPGQDVAQTALSEARDAGLSLVSMQSLLFGVEGAALFEGAAARAAFVSGMMRAIALAGRFGIPNLVFGSPAQRRVPEGTSMDRALDDAAEVFRKLGGAAAAAGTRIAIEANPALYGTNFLTSFEDALAFVRRVDHPAVVAILDLGAMHINGSLDQVPAIVERVACDLNHVHVSEPGLAPAPASAVHLAPVLQALERHGYDKAVSIEMKRPEGGLRDVRSAISRLIEASRTMGAAHA